MNATTSLGKRYRDRQGGGGANTRQRHLKAHGQCQLVTGEPLYYDLAHRDACYLAAYTIDGKTKHGPEYLDAICTYAERQCDTAVKVLADSPELDKGSAEHEDGAEYAGKADADLVENDAPEEKQQ